MSAEKRLEHREDLERYAESYLRPSAARTVDQKVVGMLVERTVPRLEGPDILEMGYGDGAWTGALIARFGRSSIVDASAELLAGASAEHGEKARTHRSYFEEFEPPCRFDSILCTYVLEHVTDAVGVLCRCRGWLKENGLLFVAVPNAGSLHRRLAVRMGIQRDIHELGEADRSIGHRRVYDAGSLERDLAEAGFRVESRASVMCKPLPNGSLAGLDDAQLRGLFDLGDGLPEDLRGILAFFCRVSGG